MHVVIEGQTFTGTKETVLKCCEAAGYSALRAEQSPHAFFQYAEFLKRENLHGNDRHKDMVQLRKPRSDRSYKDRTRV